MKGLSMIRRLGEPVKLLSCMFAIALLFSNCAHTAPRLDSKGSPQTEYAYQLPDRIEDDWEISSLDKEGLASDKIVRLIEDILTGKFPNVHSVLLVKDGKLILEEYFYGYDRDDLHDLASATKSISSILVGILLDEDMLKNVDQYVYQLFSGYRKTEWIDKKYEITVRHLLSMTSGIEWDENRDINDPRHDYFAMRRGGDWIRYVFNKKLVAPPGQKFNYNGGLSALLGEIIRRNSGLNAEKFSKKYLFDPLGISHYSWLKYNDGSINTGGGLLLTPRDMAKIGQMMLNNGMWNGQQVVSEEWIAESSKNYVVPEAWGTGYGYQWWLGEANINGHTVQTYFAQGLGGQFIFIVPKMNLTAVFTSQLYNNPDGQFRGQVMMTDYILPALLPPAPPYDVITLDQDVLEDYVGEYEFKRWNIKLSVIREGKKLFVLSPDMEKAELFPISETAFRADVKEIGNIQIDFSHDDSGKNHHLELRIGFSHLDFDKTR
jgi:CubicO group peptidase (beta-lactamase class C family)